jgi:hypothetical protein
LRELASHERDGAVVRRLLAIAAVLDGDSRTKAARPELAAPEAADKLTAAIGCPKLPGAACAVRAPTIVTMPAIMAKPGRRRCCYRGAQSLR